MAAKYVIFPAGEERVVTSQELQLILEMTEVEIVVEA